MQALDVTLFEIHRRFRWKSEMKSNSCFSTDRKPISHGNYLSGKIELPPSNLVIGSRYKLELCLVPSQYSEPGIYKAHPYLLHLTHPENFSSLSEINKESWKLKFDVEISDGQCIKVYHQNILLYKKYGSAISLGNFC